MRTSFLRIKNHPGFSAENAKRGRIKSVGELCAFRIFWIPAFFHALFCSLSSRMDQRQEAPSRPSTRETAPVVNKAAAGNNTPQNKKTGQTLSGK